MSNNMNLLRLSAVIEKADCKRPTIYRMIQKRIFPSPHKIGFGKISAWRSDEVEQWIGEQTGRAA